MARLRTLLILALVSCAENPSQLAGGKETAEGGAPADRVLLITCDTLRRDRLGAYGYGLEITPNLDAFAREALVFDAAYSTAPITSPAICSLLTGRLPDELGVSSGNMVLLPPEATTLAEVLSAEGIATAAIVSNWVLRKREGLAQAGVQQGFEYFDDTMTKPERNRMQISQRVATGTTDAALQWLADRPAERFFLWVHYQDPHGPYTPPAEDIAAVDRPYGSEKPLRVSRSHESRGKLPAYQVLGQERHPDFYRIRYDAEIRYFDRELGRLLDGLRSQELYDDALIVFTADHGESMGEHGSWFAHGENLYRELVHVPFLVRYPRGASAPAADTVNGLERVPLLVSHLDVWPTVLEALGIQADPGNYRSLFAAEAEGERIIAHHLRAPDAANRWLGISTERYRLLVNQRGSLLYDVLEDPGEIFDLAESQPERVAELLEGYQRMLAEDAQRTLQATEPEVTSEDRRRLDALGYTGDD